MLKRILSMKMAVVVLFIFGVLIGTATFIENDYGTQTAQALIYKAKWFEFFLAYFIIILIYQIFKYKSYKTKFPVFLYHFSFIVIALGALTTRYIGYEGIMHIREGQETNKMVSDTKVLEFFAKNGKDTALFEKELYFSTMSKNSLNKSLTVGDKDVNIELVKYLPSYTNEVVADPKGSTILEMKISANGKGDIHYFKAGKIKDFGKFYVAYDAKNILNDKPTFEITTTDNGELRVKFPYILKTLDMGTKESAELDSGDNVFHTRMLYQFGGNAIVLKEIHEKSTLKTVSHDLKSSSSKAEFIQMKISVGDKSRVETFKVNKGEIAKLRKFTLDGVEINMRIGAKLIELPFSIKLDKFKLDRYPGSMTPSSYASDVVLIDKEQNLNMPYEIYMNHILDHRNYRFFQSSYDPDEKGTILSVNHDPGTWPTYLGYILLTLGMLWSLFIPNGRFQKLLKGARKLQDTAIVALVALFLAFSPQNAQASAPTVDASVLKQMSAYDQDHAKKFGMLAVQDHMGRMKPMDTIAHEVISKITGKTSMFDLEPNQMFLGMIMQPELYQKIPMIKVGHKKIALDLGLPEDAKYAKFSDFFDAKEGAYKLYKQVSEASIKKPLEKSQYDKELIKIDERVNVSYMVYQGTLMRIFPKPNDANNKWYAPMDALKSFNKEDIEKVKMSISAYFLMINQAIKDGNWANANLALRGIQKYQKTYGSEVLPSAKHIEVEIWYNKLGLFGKLVPLYLLLGLALIILAFINVLKPSFSMKWIMRVSWSILIFGFLVHVLGMAIRWYIAGHAPWSNAYESIVFIAASTVFAGIVLARKSPFALAGAAILAGVTMAVAHMNFINPEITTLVPVLKSYWLMIHVATIISGDGFLGLGSILSFLVLVLFIIRGKNGDANIDRSIKELTNLSEMAIIIGLFLYTIGNFLGGVWANESWGRYWGWDSKETWAAVTILIYAAVIHLRFIPSLKSAFVYNVASLWAYSTVIMTYFGVNYYLSGLHSYAAGDPIPMPVWVYYTVAGLFVLTLLAYRNRKV
ncbi:Putative cytochrome C-type biogenesis protein [hydrothermal vent metagenome]|uniref:Putative cytochrome C-type biogenesis protein n=1 Tax=hydrothermal vent metagenome TaxID=652676 RepID=A0A1W1EDK8_9ZZZZ